MNLRKVLLIPILQLMNWKFIRRRLCSTRKFKSWNVDWCKCGGNCKIEKRDIDCLCCQEVHALNLKFDAENNIRCITESKYYVLIKQYWKLLVFKHLGKGN